MIKRVDQEILHIGPQSGKVLNISKKEIRFYTAIKNMVEGEIIRGIGFLYILLYKNAKRFLKGRKLLSAKDLRKKLACSDSYNKTTLGCILNGIVFTIIMTVVLLTKQC